MLGIGIGLWNNVAASGGGGAPATVWNNSSGSPASSSDYTLSNGNLTATRSVNTGNVSVFGSVSHSGSGDWSFTITMGGTVGNLSCGLANASHLNTNYVGQDANSIGYLNIDGNVYKNSTGMFTGATYTASDTITVRLKNGKAYFAKNGTWQNSADPVAETGGVDVSALGALYPCCSSDNARAFTINPTAW